MSRSPASEPENAPETREHHDLLGIDVRAGEAERFDVELVELPIAALLRPLMAEHRPAGPDALWPLVGERMLDRGADDAGRRFGAQCEALAVQLVLERVHLVLDDVGRIPDPAHEQRCGLDDRHAQVAIAVLGEHGACRVLEAFPDHRLVGQHVIHPADGADGRFHATAFTAIVFRSGVKCAARGSPP